ncbi:hypothetical protein [Nitratifractor sp.]
MKKAITLVGIVALGSFAYAGGDIAPAGNGAALSWIGALATLAATAFLGSRK